MTELAVIVTARNEADRLAPTLRALAEAFPGAVLWVADDASVDGTASVAAQAGARVVSAAERLGKGGAASLAASAPLREGDPIVLFADADLGESAGELRQLVEAVRNRESDIVPAMRGTGDSQPADLAIAAFS